MRAGGRPKRWLTAGGVGRPEIWAAKGQETVTGILIVDDDDGVRHFLSRVLSARYRVLEARDGEEALRVFARERPDLVITDLNMHGKNGDEVIRVLRRCHPATGIIAISGVDYALATVEREADRILQKPLDVDVLEEAVAGLLRA